jgi:hypothetical protein
VLLLPVTTEKCAQTGDCMGALGPVLSTLQVAVLNIMRTMLRLRWSTTSTSCMHCIKVQLSHNAQLNHAEGCGKQLYLSIAVKLFLNLVAKSLYI